ncbi:hypothetical protein J1N35_001446 [Gossypium stocksii]|uniref:Uncharacterized protein n=1 Tax=Gossypium stocksii TaxID=47602 RepID=A0A9D4AM50_9ROSI|nr:hypothetical protein J1N35_001446 [Gossypium stocksii]
MARLSNTMYKKSLLRAVGRIIGKVIKVDHNTEATTRGHFARLVVVVNLAKPFVSKMLINDVLHKVEYNSFPTILFRCGRYEHVKDVFSSTHIGLQHTNPIAKLKLPVEFMELRVQCEDFGS